MVGGRDPKLCRRCKRRALPGQDKCGAHGAKRKYGNYDRTCRNNGSCPWCRFNRRIQEIRMLLRAAVREDEDA